MAFHSNNYNCLLYIGTTSSLTSSAALPAYGSEGWTVVGLTGKIKLPKFEKSVGRFSILNDQNKRVVGGKQGDKDIVVDIVEDDSDATHTSLKNDAQASGNVYRNWKVVRPNGSIWYAKGFISSWEVDEYDASGDAKEVHGQFNIAVDGAVTIV